MAKLSNQTGMKKFKYTPALQPAAAWLDAARKRIIEKDKSFQGYGNTSFDAMIAYFELTPAILQNIVSKSARKWYPEDVDKLLHLVFVLNGRPKSRHVNSPNKMGITDRQGMVSILSEIVNQVDAICKIFDRKNATNPNLKEYTVNKALNVCRRNSPEDFATLLEATPGNVTNSWVEEIVKRTISVEEMLQVAERRKRIKKRSKLEKRGNVPDKVSKKYSYLSLIDELRDDKGRVVIDTVLRKHKFKPRTIYALAFEQCEYFFEKTGVKFSKYKINPESIEARVKLDIKNRVATQMMNIDAVCFDKFGIHLDEIPTHDKEALTRLCLKNVPALDDYFREHTVAISPHSKKFLN